MSDDQFQSTREATLAYRSQMAATVHEGVQAMHRLDLVDAATMREFDGRCLIGGEKCKDARHDR